MVTDRLSEIEADPKFIQACQWLETTSKHYQKDVVTIGFVTRQKNALRDFKKWFDEAVAIARSLDADKARLERELAQERAKWAAGHEEYEVLFTVAGDRLRRMEVLEKERDAAIKNCQELRATVREARAEAGALRAAVCAQQGCSSGTSQFAGHTVICKAINKIALSRPSPEAKEINWEAPACAFCGHLCVNCMVRPGTKPPEQSRGACDHDFPERDGHCVGCGERRIGFKAPLAGAANEHDYEPDDRCRLVNCQAAKPASGSLLCEPCLKRLTLAMVAAGMRAHGTAKAERPRETAVSEPASAPAAASPGACDCPRYRGAPPDEIGGMDYSGVVLIFHGPACPSGGDAK